MATSCPSLGEARWSIVDDTVSTSMAGSYFIHTTAAQEGFVVCREEEGHLTCHRRYLPE